MLNNKYVEYYSPRKFFLGMEISDEHKFMWRSANTACIPWVDWKIHNQLSGSSPENLDFY